MLLLGALLLTTACATAPSAPLPSSAGPVSFAFGPDTFAFRNEIRARHPEEVEPELYAHYCFVLARGVRQFFQFARFDPEAPRVSEADYVARVRAIAERMPWEDTPAERIVIPGYPHLRAFSAEHEAAVKEGLGSPVGTWLHWTNWRVTWPASKGHQADVAEAVAAELAKGRLVQLLVTNWPIPELNHTVIAYRFDDRGDRLDFTVWDPNEIDTPGVVTFDRVSQQFWATNMYATRSGPIRVYRMYYSRFL